MLSFLHGQVKQAVVWALRAGYRHIDCAAIYDNEAEIGEALRETVGPSKVKPAPPPPALWIAAEH